MRKSRMLKSLFTGIGLMLAVCVSASAATRALWIDSPSQLPGGSAAAGQVGDILLSNDAVSFVISSLAHPFGYADSGGNIIDAVSAGGSDAFGQLYTYFDADWPRQAVYTQLLIIDDGTGGGPAQVWAEGVDSSDSELAVVTRYFLADGATQVEIQTTLTNTGNSAINDFEVGDAFEWGVCSTFAPGYGFAVSGTTTGPWLAGAYDTLAYGYFGEGQQIWGPHGNGWSDISVEAVDLAAHGGHDTVTRYLSVGDAGVASVSDAAHAAAGASIGTVSGFVGREDTGAPLPGATINVYDGGGSLYTQMICDAAGEASATLAPGSWRLVADVSGYDTAETWYPVYLGGLTNFDFRMSSGGGAGSYAVGDEITLIQRPLSTIPQIATDGGTFTINCLADPSTTGWSAALHHGETTVPLGLVSAVYDPGTTWWNLDMQVPSENFHVLYDLRVVADGGLDDTTFKSVQLIPQQKSEYYFLHITDTHLPTHLFYDNPESVTDTTEVEDLRAIIRDAELIHPEFVLHTGDLVNEGELEDFEMRRYYSRAQRLLAEFDVPVYLIAGNHDIGGWNDTPPVAGTARRDWWRFFGWSILDDPPAGAPERTQNYSFDYGGVHFTALEAYDNYDMWRSQYYGSESFTAPQLQWLQSDPAAAPGGLAKVLFYHYDFANQLDLNSLGVDMALWGHIHRDSGSIFTQPFDLATDQVCDGGRSYRLIRVVDGVLDPRPTLHAGGAGENLRVAWSPSNTGLEQTVTATITNTHSERFQDGRLVFEMPKLAGTPVITGGVLNQIDSGGGTALWYVDVDIAASGTTVVTATIDTESDVETPSLGRTIFRGNHPNPFNPSTTLSYYLPRDDYVRLSIIDLRGHEVTLLVDGFRAAGERSAVWDGRSRDGSPMPSGTYLVQLRAGDEVSNHKISLAR